MTDQSTSPISQDLFNSLTTKTGEHPTAGTPAAATPAPAPIPAPAPSTPSYDGFNILVVSDLATLGPDMATLMGNLKLGLHDELVCFVRRAVGH